MIVERLISLTSLTCSHVQVVPIHMMLFCLSLTVLSYSCIKLCDNCLSVSYLPTLRCYQVTSTWVSKQFENKGAILSRKPRNSQTSVDL